MEGHINQVSFYSRKNKVIMKNTVYFKWFMDSLSESQKKDYREMSINQQKDWYISYLENHYKSKKVKEL